MSLRIKTLMVMSIMLLSLLVAIYFFSHVFILDGADRLEKQMMEGNVQKAINYFHEELHRLASTALDYAAWNDTYDYTLRPNKDYLESNYPDSTFTVNKIAFVYLLDKEEEVLFARGFDLLNELEAPLPADFHQQFTARSSIFLNNSDEFCVTGLIMLKEGPALLAARPIVRSDATGPAVGTLIMGRYLDSALVAKLEELLGIPISIYDATYNIAEPEKEVVESLIKDNRVTVRNQGDDYMAGYALLNDVFNDPALVLKVEGKRDIYLQNQSTLLYYLIALIIFGLVCAVVLIWFLEHNILQPLYQLNDLVEFVGTKRDLSSRIHLKANIEFTKLVHTINYMLETLEKSQVDLKESERRFKHLSFRDSLTGYYNRTYFEYEMDKLNKDLDNHLPLSIICADVDGLKIINDTFGHQAGDEQLKTAARIMAASIRKGDTLARIGGDEFCIILPGVKESVAIARRENIMRMVEEHNLSSPCIPLYLSIGMANADRDKDESIYQVFKRADDSMYSYKLSQTSSVKSKVIDILLAALAQRDFIAQGHAERLVRMAELMADKLRLSEEVKRDLILLAKVHDLGKIGLPDEILFKKGKLTRDEYEKMKTHTRSGYNIANRSKELAHIAELVLHHHENWDGSGYPAGMKGEEIPLPCRILSILDAFDAMTNERPYHRGNSKEEALKELKRCAGSQFEPRLVDVFVEIISEQMSNKAR